MNINKTELETSMRRMNEYQIIISEDRESKKRVCRQMEDEWDELEDEWDKIDELATRKKLK